MKKMLLFGAVVSFYCTSCATIFDGKITNCQRDKPSAGQHVRKIKPVAFAFDVLFFPGLIIDFSNCSIYKPCRVSPSISRR
ncbi:MAG TPA: hypothetical protein VK809_01430 [Bacteroidia bacterium]|jgi:hypothetical protein|nr:hypothetical protein [Bacteroidia bacterium]